MGHIASVADPYSGVILKSFSAVQQNTDLHFARRSGTYAIIATDGGVDPFGAQAMPAATRDVTYQFREYFRGGTGDDTHHVSMDAARDALMLSLGGGLPVRLEYLTDGKTSRYCNAKAKDYPMVVAVDSDFSADFRVTFEMVDPFWSDLFPANLPSWGHFVWGDGTLWGGSPFSMNAVASATTVYAADLTGATAFDLPKITISGPYGGSLGFKIENQSITIPTNVGLIPVTLQYNEPLLTGESVTIDPASMDVTKQLATNAHVSAFDKVSWPTYQRYMFLVDPRTKDRNPINQIWISPLGVSPTTGGKGLIAFTRRFW